MKQEALHIPVYRQFIHLIENGLSLLDDETINSVKKFIEEKQHFLGGFVDRGGNPDLYYSLFGYWLASALKVDEQIKLLKIYISAEKEKEHAPIEQFALMLIDTGLFSAKYKTATLLRKLKGFSSNPAYQLFLLLLVADASGNRFAFFRFTARVWLKFYNPGDDAPCSMIAALLVAKNELGMKFRNEQLRLLSYFDEENGFRSFSHVQTADLLSTAVALFALLKTGFDMRLVRPVSLNFIQQNFEEGAFLSGDGDQTRDLEYTFYGLLALGCLSGNN